MADDPYNTPPGQEPYDDGYGGNGNGNGNGGEQQLNTSSTPTVAASPTRVLMTLVLVVAAVAFVLYSFLSEDEGRKRDDDDEPRKIATNTIEPPPPPPLPPPDPPAITPPPPPPPIMPDPPSFDIPDDMDDGGIFGGGGRGGIGEGGPPPLTDEQRLQRIKSPMLVVGSDGVFDTSDADRARAEDNLAGSDPNLAFSRDIAASDTKRAIATSIGTDLRAIVAQGKVIDAVLETAINTDLPGTLRAIVSRDIYPEAGSNPIIPKGSRLIGAYNTGILRGQKRVFIVWMRLIRPDGIDIKIASPGTDALGRAGIGGYVDNKFMEQFSTALLTSALSVGVAIAAEGFIGEEEQVTSTTNTDGSTTQSGSAGAQATAEAVRNLGEVGSSIVEKTLDLRPTITVRQGTRINVMVNRDLIFPSETASQAKFVE